MQKVGHKKGETTEKSQGQEIKRGKVVLWGGKGKERRSPKAHCPRLLLRNGIDTQKSGGCRTPPPQREGKSKDPVGPKSSQVNVLQIEQQSVGDAEGGSQPVGRRGWEITRGIRSQEAALSSCPDVGRIWSWDEKGKSGEVQTPRQKEE